nr:MAG TPA: major capsid protein [Caudoviricetes sp.]
MVQSQFVEYIRKIFPRLQNVVDTVNGKRNGEQKRTYLHKTMLRKVYSADQKWSNAAVNTTYVAADMVSMNSPLPIKSRDAIAHANGSLPKIGMKKIMFESDINAVNIMKAQGAEWTNIANKLTSDPIACSVGIDEQNEANFLTGLSNGIVAVEDENNTGTALRINFGYLPENCFGVETQNELTLDDIKRVLAYADNNGDTIITIAIALSTYNKLRQTQGAKELVANYRGQTFDSSTKLPVPTASLFDEAFADDNNGVRFLKIDRSIISEKNGKRKPYKPWNPNKLIFLTTEEVGALVWGTLAEKTNPVEGVVYSTVDEYKLISRYRTTEPFTETTSGQALVLSVIENVDQIYSLDISEAQAVDSSAESSDSTDVKITIWGNTYKKPEFVKEFNKITGKNLASTIADDKLIAAVNRLNDFDEAKLKSAVESHKSE